MEYCTQDVVRFLESVDIIPGGCWVWKICKNQDGYGYFSLHGRMIRAHKFSYLVFNGPVRDGMVLMHTCDNPACVNPLHLVQATQRDNIMDAIEKGRFFFNRGGRNPRSRLSTEAVIHIRRLADTGNPVNHCELAREHGVSETAIRKIIERKTWKHIL